MATVVLYFTVLGLSFVSKCERLIITDNTSVELSCF